LNNGAILSGGIERDGMVTKVRASDGTILGTFPILGNSPYMVAFDGGNIWVSNSNSNQTYSVSKM
jgi:hypothetical protein